MHKIIITAYTCIHGHVILFILIYSYSKDCSIISESIIEGSVEKSNMIVNSHNQFSVATCGMDYNGDNYDIYQNGNKN